MTARRRDPQGPAAEAEGVRWPAESEVCSEDALTDLLYGRGSEEERLATRTHLTTCAECRKSLQLKNVLKRRPKKPLIRWHRWAVDRRRLLHVYGAFSDEGMCGVRVSSQDLRNPFAAVLTGKFPRHRVTQDAPGLAGLGKELVRALKKGVLPKKIVATKAGRLEFDDAVEDLQRKNRLAVPRAKRTHKAKAFESRLAAAEELDRMLTRPEVRIVATSLRGFREVCPRLWDDIEARPDSFYFLLAHPNRGVPHRDEVEGRFHGAISSDVRTATRKLLERNVSPDRIRFFRERPTAMVVITNDEVFLNPYPPASPGHSGPCFLYPASNPVYQRTRDRYFEAPWELRSDDYQAVEEFVKPVPTIPRRQAPIVRA